ncbi:UvrD-helicase domain-containing protein [Paenactinomyces guangxiensis]|uniref:DNA 3'-5' helicase n=1 Tax=Paenactinomyces guangxiensis TaxID=1490290 RepID=A0A7W1WN43_9BACL|nr:UvrD-helicase domain-containing protein [Paenactinomyces guangxiensis]MBA4492972.1 UvrD-helicase domain-containing protein [Paenactinomyces guangxiensis]MBH8590179.1 UvrD-helicase domain-containing protein [Paenactinomyces guangxiensis]
MSTKIRLTPDQQAAVDSLNQNCIVAAGAGSGKTRVLVERYLNILAAHDFDSDLLDQIVAITFTEKAATEMKERIRQGIRDRLGAAKKDGLFDEADGWYQLSTELERARITTIHSFCRRILQRYPIEAGVDPEFNVLEEFEARWLLKEAVEETLSAVFKEEQTQNNGVRLFDQWLVGVGLKSAQSQLMSVVLQCFTFGWSPKELTRVTMDHFQQMQDQLEQRWDEMSGELEMQLLQSAGELLLVKKIKKADEFRASWSDLREIWAKTEEWPERLDLLSRLRSSLGGNWGSRAAVKLPLQQCREACDQLTDLIKGKLYLPDEKELLTLFCHIIKQIADRYQQLKKERAGVDFDEMQWRVCRLLDNYPDIRAEMQQKIRYLMVDEFQDTNDLQKQLIDLLIKNDRGDSKPGKCFVVGDPKQSIYRFRGADVSLFHRTRREILQSGGKEVSLSANFRSHPKLISFYNHFFAQLMSQEKESPNYYQAVEAREDQSRIDVAVEYLAVPHKKEELPTGWERRDAEARMLAEHIFRMVSEGTPPGDIAVLFRAMTHVKKYEQELARFNIPFHVVKGRGFYDRQEVLDLLHFLRLLIEPENRLALVGVLRSPFCGVSDETILRLALQGSWNGTDKEWTELRELPQEERSKLLAFNRLRARAGEWVGSIHVADLMERILKECGYLTVLWATPDGKQGAANLKKLIQQARSISGLEAFSVSHYLERVDLLIAEQQAETEALIESEHSDSVKLMTIHQSKGLEFPVVYIPDLSYQHTPRHGAVHADPHAGLVLVIKDERGESIEPVRWKQAMERNRDLEWEESVRLLYVAATRAENRLILSGSPEELKEGKSLMEVTKWSHWLDGILDYGKIDWKEKKWVFSQECLPIRVHSDLPGEQADVEQTEVPLEKYLAGDLTVSCPEPLQEEVVFLQPRGFTEADRLEISVTDWKGLINCPRKHFYQHVLGLPRLKEAETAGSAEKTVLPAFDPKEKGTVVHRVIELLSHTGGQTIEWEGVARQVWDEIALPLSERQRANEEIRPYVANFLHSRIYAEQKLRATPLTEQKFSVDLKGVRFFGVIDLLHHRPDGTREVIDYKTDELRPEEAKETAAEYLPQLQLYVLATKQKWEFIPEQATLYFLKPNLEVSFTVTDEWLQDAEKQLEKNVQWLRKTSAYEPWSANPGKRCRYCDFKLICDAGKPSP